MTFLTTWKEKCGSLIKAQLMEELFYWIELDLTVTVPNDECTGVIFPALARRQLDNCFSPHSPNSQPPQGILWLSSQFIGLLLTTRHIWHGSCDMFHVKKQEVLDRSAIYEELFYWFELDLTVTVPNISVYYTNTLYSGYCL